MSREIIHNILDLARWAPSGDNTQPWRFEIVSDNTVLVHGFDTRSHVLYDFDGHPSHIAHGAVLETIRIAATIHGLNAKWSIETSSDDRNPIYHVRLEQANGVAPDPLFAFIKTRTVQRRPMRTTPLTELQRDAIVRSVGVGFGIRLFESRAEKLGIAKILWNSARIRLTCPEAYLVHKEIIEWRARYSKTKIPELAVGVDSVTARLMEWALRSWDRVDFMNRFMFGTILPRIELDLLPALACAAHILIKPEVRPSTLADWVALGCAVQRVWLTAASVNLHLQPQMTPLIFQWYARAGRKFTSKTELMEKADRLSGDVDKVFNTSPDELNGFFARVGTSAPPPGRSIRHDLNEVLR